MTAPALTEWDTLVTGLVLGHLQAEGLDATGVTDGEGRYTGEIDLELPWASSATTRSQMADRGCSIIVRLHILPTPRPDGEA